jgi:DNA polymerase-1
VLFEKLDLPAPSNKKRETGYSTEASVLEDLRDEHPIAGHVLKYRELSKLKSTYTDALQEMIDPDTGRLHASFNQTATATGRLSSSEPNLQNIPVRTRLGRRIRSCFVPREDDMSFLSADYSQVELRLLAHCSGDERLTQAFRDGRDIHTVVTAETHDVSEEEVTSEMRQRGKAVNFGIIYGQKAYGLSQQLDVSVDEARRFIESYFERYPGVREFIGRTIDRGRKQGYVSTIWGRRRYVPGLRGSGSVRGAAERVAVNTVIQGSAADLIKQAMIDVADEVEGMGRTRMLMQIHDELVFETPDDRLDELSELVEREMSGAMDLSVPLKVDIATGKNWEDAK